MNSPEKGCQEFCKEFNINKVSDVFDGEQEVFKKMHKNLKQFNKLYQKGLPELLQQNLEKWTEDKIKILEENSVTSSNGGVDIKEPMEETFKPEQFENKINIKKMTNFFEYIHEHHPIQVEKLDDQISPLTLFKIKEKPLDITDFSIVFKRGYGIDPLRDQKESNFRLRRD